MTITIPIWLLWTVGIIVGIPFFIIGCIILGLVFTELIFVSGWWR
jgi:hypothetical protein